MVSIPWKTESDLLTDRSLKELSELETGVGDIALSSVNKTVFLERLIKYIASSSQIARESYPASFCRRIRQDSPGNVRS